jgi:acyl carrier protein
MEEIREKVLDLISRKVGKRVALDDSFVVLQLDSLAMAELAYDVEQLLGVKADSGVLDCDTVGDFIEYATELKGRVQSR